MAIATYLFCSLQTTGLVTPGAGPVHITELCMLGVKRKDLLNISSSEEPKLQYKIRMCFNPPKTINAKSASLTGLSNKSLTNEAKFDKKTFKLIKAFINSLEKPVCLVAHNGFRFHFPILQYHFKKMGVKLADHIMCADSIEAFTAIMPSESDYDEDHYEVFEFNYGSKKLDHIYKQFAIGKRNLAPFQAENVCIMLMKSVLGVDAEGFVDWVDENSSKFSEVSAMIM